MKMKSINRITMQQMKTYYHSSTDTVLDRIMNYINSKTKFDKFLSN